MVAYHCHLWRALAKSPVSGVLIVYTFIAAWFVGGLTCFHVYLICTNQTTYENFRYRYDRKRNPHNRGLARNVIEVFFSKIPTSRNNFRANVKEVSVSSFTMSPSQGRITSPEILKTNREKRQAVDTEDLEDCMSRIESMSSLERCGTEPRHTNLRHNDDGENTLNIHALAAKFGTEQTLRDKEKIPGGDSTTQ